MANNTVFGKSYSELSAIFPQLLLQLAVNWVRPLSLQILILQCWQIMNCKQHGFWRKLFRAIAPKLSVGTFRSYRRQVLQPLSGITKEIQGATARRREPPGHEPQQTFGWGPSVQGGVPKLVVSWHSTPFMGRLGRWTPSRNSCKILSSLEGSQASSSEFVAVEPWPRNVGMHHVSHR